jgi:hypothetical protein
MKHRAALTTRGRLFSYLREGSGVVPCGSLVEAIPGPLVFFR